MKQYKLRDVCQPEDKNTIKGIFAVQSDVMVVGPHRMQDWMENVQ